MHIRRRRARSIAPMTPTTAARSQSLYAPSHHPPPRSRPSSCPLPPGASTRVEARRINPIRPAGHDLRLDRCHPHTGNKPAPRAMPGPPSSAESARPPAGPPARAPANPTPSRSPPASARDGSQTARSIAKSPAKNNPAPPVPPAESKSKSPRPQRQTIPTPALSAPPTSDQISPPAPPPPTTTRFFIISDPGFPLVRKSTLLRSRSLKSGNACSSFPAISESLSRLIAGRTTHRPRKFHQKRPPPPPSQ